ncbi:glycosyl hydrolases family 38 N-terminal domain-containing protein [Lasiosphaeria miniovina]|uniref:Glycosyl hydrolases family 38 N-terminal domain-containing protein n=1 Tax=Lasiosphaeria miniovina TaxID=1954250 RepID=A0AA40AME1_9PEZI|nr:glycosyl hydrolases family 38 N-terminal domain-containing protein [Lasiosphaeria miniovina]KAK0718499.1 glycosyl hydrolases family 38 N-terminal domain-containing protein [Lasiosphaeria miniovina]
MGKLCSKPGSPPEGGPPGYLFVVSTSHMDWDWRGTFEQYYSVGIPNGIQGPNCPVHRILYDAIGLMQTSDYQYHLAEMAWLRRYLSDHPDQLSILASLKDKFFLLGGGFVSPDSLVSNGEAFIRNYLYGRKYVRSIGLGEQLVDVCWIPDDFGHDPQLPVVVDAMGLRAACFWRVPGNEPTQPSAYNPVSPPPLPRDNMKTQLANAGVTFAWQAADGSTIVGHQMYCGYGVVGNQSSADNTFPATVAATLSKFVLLGENGTFKPATVDNQLQIMVPCGGDFSWPSSAFWKGVAQYGAKPQDGIELFRGLGGFIDTVVQNRSALGVPQQIDPSMFWTGYFSSRVQLKIDQQRTVNRLTDAEGLLTLLCALSNVSPAVLTAVGQQLDACWQSVAISTHHDFVTGTSPDQTYYLEQLPLSSLAVRQSADILSHAVSLLGNVVKPRTKVDAELPFVAFNPCGFRREAGGMVVVSRQYVDQQKNYTYRWSGGGTGDAQWLADGDLEVASPTVGSLGYATVYLEPTAQRKPSRPTITSAPESDDTSAPPTVLVFENSTVSVTISSAAAWSVTSIIDKVTSRELVAPKGYGNQLQVYREDQGGFGSGNLYQMGSEFYPQSTTQQGFSLSGNDAFAAVGGYEVANDSGTHLQRFRGTIQSARTKLTLTVEYSLYKEERALRVRVTGSAAGTPSSAQECLSVVTTWALVSPEGTPPASMSYGTANHWTSFNPSRDITYWSGPTFRATHNYVNLMTSGAQAADCGSIYHEAARAWALSPGSGGAGAVAVQGILFRNAPAGGRGASGSDIDSHTQDFAFRLPDADDAKSGVNAHSKSLRESMALQKPFCVAPVAATGTLNYLATLGDMYDSLASVSPDTAMIRVARLQGSSGIIDDEIQAGPTTGPCPFSFVLRLYQPTNDVGKTYTVQIPFLPINGDPNNPLLSTNNQKPDELPYNKAVLVPGVKLVTALEEPLPASSTQPQPTYDGNGNVTVTQMPTLATLVVQSVGTTVLPTQ